MTVALQVLLLLGLAAALAAPLEALRWWAAQEPSPAPAVLAAREAARSEPVPADPHPAYLVYLSGVGAIDGERANAERRLLGMIERQLPALQVVTGVYPYSVQNLGLTRGRWSSAWWRLVRRLSRWRLTGAIEVLVYARNVLQFAVSADHRYGPMYAIGVGRVVAQQLVAAGRPTGSASPVVLLGWSGGAQIAVSCARYLALAGVPVQVVSLGGVITSDPGLERLDHLWQLVGSRDWVPAIGRLFPGRWPGRRTGYWAAAVARGRISELDPGPLRHLGRGSYLSGARLPDGRSCRQASADAIVTCLRRGGIRE